VCGKVLQAVMTRLPDGPDEAPWAYFGGLRVLVVDGFTMNVAKTPEKVAAFGYARGHVVRHQAWSADAEGIDFPDAAQVFRIRRDVFDL
jgi:hypothetical protein